ncbi:MAG: PilT/PilU family type 4a pilus ATPase [bacterium]|nr:PilT/PilU family type 4a pilus ATPase [bacterium]
MRSVLGTEQSKKFKEQKEIDSSYEVKDGTRLRINCHFERGYQGLVARTIPQDIPTLEEIGLGEVAEELCNLSNGLVLFTGPTGSGKSTSLAAMIQHISTQRPAHIVTLEDPIEFVFPKGQGVIRQRQFGQDFHSFADALKHVLRQDPDIVMVGEMRDLETIAAALTLAETGHLIFGTLHTPSAVQTIDRIVDVFPPHQQNQIRTQLSLSLKGIIAQRLIPCEHGGRIAQREILINNTAVANIIRDNRIQELKSAIQTGVGEGMCTFERDAKRLYKAGDIDKETYQWVSESD